MAGKKALSDLTYKFDDAGWPSVLMLRSYMEKLQTLAKDYIVSFAKHDVFVSTVSVPITNSTVPAFVPDSWLYI